MIVCDEMIYVMDIVPTKMTNAMAISTVSIHTGSKKVRQKIDCYILHAVLVVILLLLLITIICYQTECDPSEVNKDDK